MAPESIENDIYNEKTDVVSLSGQASVIYTLVAWLRHFACF